MQNKRLYGFMFYRDVQKRILTIFKIRKIRDLFTNFKTLGDEFSICDLIRGSLGPQESGAPNGISIRPATSAQLTRTLTTLRVTSTVLCSQA